MKDRSFKVEHQIISPFFERTIWSHRLPSKLKLSKWLKTPKALEWWPTKRICQLKNGSQNLPSKDVFTFHRNELGKAYKAEENCRNCCLERNNINANILIKIITVKVYWVFFSMPETFFNILHLSSKQNSEATLLLCPLYRWGNWSPDWMLWMWYSCSRNSDHLTPILSSLLSYTS